MLHADQHRSYSTNMEARFPREIRDYFSLLGRVGGPGLNALQAYIDKQYTLYDNEANVTSKELLQELYALREFTGSTLKTDPERKPFPQWVWMLFLERGEQLYSQHRPLILEAWTALQQMEVVDMRTALVAVFGHALGCAARNLDYLSDYEITDWLGLSAKLWTGLGVCDLDKIVTVYELAAPAIQHLLLDAIIARCQMTKEKRSMFDTLGEHLSSSIQADPIQRLPRINPTPIRTETLAKFKAILQKNEVKGMYQELYACTDPRADFEAAYSSALNVSIYSVPMLLALWDLYGVTLLEGVFFVDELRRHDPELSEGYQICICLHEFSHLLLRQGKRPWGSFHDVCTPPDVVLSPKKPSKRPAPTSPPKPSKRSKISKTESVTRPEEISPPRPTQDLINRDMPLKLHGEAGDQVEAWLFGARLDFLHQAAAAELLRWADSKISHSDFKTVFVKLNQGRPRAPGEAVAISKGSVLKKGENYIALEGYCGVTLASKYWH